MFERFKHRSREKERLDTGDYTPEEYALWEKEMRYIHAWFGEERAIKASLLRAVISHPADTVSVLDVGAGTGNLLSKLKGWTSGSRVLLTGVETSMDAVIAMRSKGLDACMADGLRLPFSDDSFDYAYCSLLLHHLDEADAVALLKEMGRVVRKRLYAFDLNRHPTAYYAYQIFGRFLLQPFTLEDGALSIMRSYTPDEMLDLARQAGLSEVQVERSKLNRLILSATS
jgi:ubiquinone/menaquinone biosynthesis C-methylase UbiE